MGKKTLLKLPVTVSGIFSQSTITSGKLFLQSFPEVIRTVHFLLKKIALSLVTRISPLLPCWLSTMSAKDDDFILLLLLLSQQLPLTAAVLSNTKLKHFLSYIELKRRDRRIPRCALVDASCSPFQRLYHSRNDQSFITFTGLDFTSFEYLLSKFRPLYYRYSPYSVNGKIVMLKNGGAQGGWP